MVAMDLVDYRLKQAKLQGENIASTLQEKVEPMSATSRSTVPQKGSISSGLICVVQPGAMLAGDDKYSWEPNSKLNQLNENCQARQKKNEER